MRLTATVAAEFPDTVEAVFDAANDIANVAAIFAGRSIVPGVQRAEVVGGGKLRPGATRRVNTSDGAVIDEAMLIFERPREVRYRLHGLGPPFSLLVREAEATWQFTATGAGARVEWRYRFELTTALAWPLGMAVLQLGFRPWMKACLANLGRLMDAASGEARPWAADG